MQIKGTAVKSIKDFVEKQYPNGYKNWIQSLSEESKNIYQPFIVSALLFFFLHVPVLFGVDKISSSTLVPMMILNTVMSLTTSVVFLLRKNTVAPILVHALYLLSLPILL